jgi:hypothetical protein
MTQLRALELLGLFKARIRRWEQLSYSNAIVVIDDSTITVCKAASSGRSKSVRTIAHFSITSDQIEAGVARALQECAG